MEGIWHGEDTEALIQSCSVKKIFLRISQNSLKTSVSQSPEECRPPRLAFKENLGCGTAKTANFGHFLIRFLVL